MQGVMLACSFWLRLLSLSLHKVLFCAVARNLSNGVVTCSEVHRQLLWTQCTNERRAWANVVIREDSWWARASVTVGECEGGSREVLYVAMVCLLWRLMRSGKLTNPH